MNVQRTDRFSMAELTERTGVPASTVHHYVRRGLLPPPLRVSAKHFLHGPEHVDSLRVIRHLRRRQRLPLARIAEMLPEILADGAEGFEAPVPDDDEPRTSTVAERILDVAIEAFGQHSYGEVSIADLCSGANVAKGTFYRHFDSKGQVFVRAADKVVLQSLARFREALEQGPQPPDPQAAGTACAAALRPGLPVLLELAKRAMLNEPNYVNEARAAFRMLVAEMGDILRPGDADNRALAGMVILDAIAQVFRGLVGGSGDPAVAGS
ncbi:MAG: TetR family transcriptional regulator [Acidimicrobiia bacterium]|nr:TetR family transcriptional regulator [Acidimicrobiia bacterium]